MIFKPAEDFKQHSLSALPTLLEKLAYICSLQTREGEYRHWGMARIHGSAPAHQAIHSAHIETATELVHLPIREIYGEYRQALARAGVFVPESFVLTAPLSDDDGLLSAHLRLLHDSVQALARQEDTIP